MVPLRHHQSAVLGVSSCSTRFPSTSVRISGVLEGDNIEHQLTIDSATEIPCIAKTLIDCIIIKSFRAKLDWVAERLSFQYGNVTTPATHNRYLYWFSGNTLYLPHMKRPYEFPVRHDLKKIRER